MALFETTTLLGKIFGEFTYVGPFTVLLLCGLGLSLP